VRTRRQAEQALLRELKRESGAVAPKPRKKRAAPPAPTVDIAGLAGLAALERWFASLGRVPHDFQRECWRLDAAGRSGLVCVPTGAGKTYAALGGPLAELIEAARGAATLPGGAAATLRVVYLSPLRAVARDLELAIRRPIDEMGLAITVGSRTGDTAASERARQRERLPEILVTTPESLSLLLTRPDAAAVLAGVRCTIVDEWHELLTSKRGVQVELALARLRRFAPEMRTWALSATIGKTERAAAAIVGPRAIDPPAIVRSSLSREVRVSSLVPRAIDRLPWSGHFGLAMLEPLLEWLDPAIPTLVFTNTRAMAERWHAELLAKRPEWKPRVALHHGSIDREERERVEAGLKSGSIGIAIATSSLDLGVDFAPVERVVQIGSPKGIARLLQRAGRACHRPGATAEVLCVPTHALELVEIAAAREAIARGEIEERPGLALPLDCLVQHLVTVALGGGFRPDELFDEVRGTAAFASLSRADFDWCLDLVHRGGRSLGAYARFRRVELADGVATVTSAAIARTHRLNVGTITADPVVSVRLERGPRLGSIEEDFIARLRPGDSFLYAGRMLEFVRLREAVASVRPARRKTPFTPHWNGARIPLSTALSASVRRTFAAIRAGRRDGPELAAAAPYLEAQAELSRIPGDDSILLETAFTDEGSHLFLYPFEGRLVHEGLAALLALRLGRLRPATFAISVNDHGLELLVEGREACAPLVTPAIFTVDRLADDLLESINLGELSLRQFREIARVSGLVTPRHPGVERSGRDLQAGTTLLWEVLREFEPDSLLLEQARREVLERQLEESRLARTLDRLARGPIERVELARPGPLAWPLMADRLGTTLSTETLAERIARFRVGGR
jgi:ATP-dependent Lhr-like helicase